MVPIPNRYSGSCIFDTITYVTRVSSVLEILYQSDILNAINQTFLFLPKNIRVLSIKIKRDFGERLTI